MRSVASPLLKPRSGMRPCAGSSAFDGRGPHPFAIVIAACLIAAATTMTACSTNAHVAAGNRVIDGDTIDLNGMRYRLANHDSPELYGAHCARERALAWKAKHRLEELLRAPHTLQPVRCWHGHTRDRYGRKCAIIRVNGEDVGDTLIREELAVKFPQPSRWRPWCRGES
jgi:endonuclease YncB( thermonuclease family)